MRGTNDTATIVSFYPGAYGPTIRIDVHDFEWLRLFQNSMIQLKNKSISELDLLSMEGVKKAEISGLKLKLGSYASISFVSSAQSEHYAADGCAPCRSRCVETCWHLLSCRHNKICLQHACGQEIDRLARQAAPS